jgi:hypothetical protein
VDTGEAGGGVVTGGGGALSGGITGLAVIILSVFCVSSFLLLDARVLLELEAGVRFRIFSVSVD